MVFLYINEKVRSWTRGKQELKFSQVKLAAAEEKVCAEGKIAEAKISAAEEKAAAKIAVTNAISCAV